MNRDQNQILVGRKVAILLTDGFEESEMVEPRKALIKAGRCGGAVIILAAGSD